MADDTLLDVFVRVAPDPNTDIEAIMKAAIEKTQNLFRTLNVKMPVTPVVTAPTQSGGSGRGGRGGGQGDELAAEFKRAQIQATELSREMQNLRKLVADVGNEDIERRFRLANAELTKIKDSLGQSSKSDPLALETTIERLNLIRREIADVRQAGVGISFASGGGTASSAFEADTAREEAAQRERTRDSWKLFLADQQRIIDENRKQLEQLNSDKARLLAIERQIDEKANTERIASLRKDIIERSSGPGAKAGSRAGLGDEYRSAREEADALSRETSRLAKIISQVRDTDLSTQFNIAKNEVIELTRAMDIADDKADLPGLEVAKERLASVRERMSALGVEATNTFVAVNSIREEFDALVNTESLNSAKAKISQNLQARSFQALGPNEKGEVIRLTNDLRELEAEFENVARAGRDSAVAISKMGEQTEQMGLLRLEISKVYETANVGSRSFNTLSNNAYQLGQAFEDAAVGYSLNGFAGAVRGAANNVAFLLNDLSRVPKVQELIGQKFAGMLPLIAGVGSALAVTVLPKIIEWLSSLNDVEAKFRDISEEMGRVSKEVDFSLEISDSIKELRRFTEEASSVQDILSRVFDLGDAAERIRDQITGVISKASSVGIIQEIDKASSLLRDELNAGAGKLEKAASDILRSAPIGGGLLKGTPFDPASGVKEFSKLSSQLKEPAEQLRKFQDLLGKIEKDSAKGIVNQKSIEQATLILRKLNDEIVDVLKSSSNLIDLSPDFAEKFKKNISAVLEEFEGFNESSKTLTSIIEDQITTALEGADRKAKELLDTQKLIRDSLEGVVGEQAEFVAEIGRAADEYDRILSQSLQQASEQGVSEKLLRQVESATMLRDQTELENRVLEQQVGIREKLQASQEKLTQLRERTESPRSSAFTNFEQFSQRIQVNALSVNTPEERARERLLEQIENESAAHRSLINTLDQLNDLYHAVGVPGLPREIAGRTKAELEDRSRILEQQPVSPVAMMNMIMNMITSAINQIVLEQRNTTEAIKTKDEKARVQ